MGDTVGYCRRRHGGGTGSELLVLESNFSNSDPVIPTQFRRLGGRAVRVGVKNSAGSVDDLDGTYTQWFKELGLAVMLIRPDYYIAAAPADKFAVSFGIAMELVLMSAPAIQEEATDDATSSRNRSIISNPAGASRTSLTGSTSPYE